MEGYRMVSSVDALLVYLWRIDALTLYSDVYGAHLKNRITRRCKLGRITWKD